MGLEQLTEFRCATWNHQTRKHVEAIVAMEAVNIEIDNDKRGIIGDFTTISDIRITKAEPE